MKNFFQQKPNTAQPHRLNFTFHAEKCCKCQRGRRGRQTFRLEKLRIRICGTPHRLFVQIYVVVFLFCAAIETAGTNFETEWNQEKSVKRRRIIECFRN